MTMATAIETAQKGEVNPFSGEKVIPTKENEILTKAREARVNELMNDAPPAPSTANTTAPPLPPASTNVAPPLPPASNVNKVSLESEKNDSDIFDDDDDDYINSALELNAAAYGRRGPVRREAGIVRPKSKSAKKAAPGRKRKLCDVPKETELEELIKPSF